MNPHAGTVGDRPGVSHLVGQEVAGRVSWRVLGAAVARHAGTHFTFLCTQPGDAQLPSSDPRTIHTILLLLMKTN